MTTTPSTHSFYNGSVGSHTHSPKVFLILRINAIVHCREQKEDMVDIVFFCQACGLAYAIIFPPPSIDKTCVSVCEKKATAKEKIRPRELWD